jgi:hypothetical protein
MNMVRSRIVADEIKWGPDYGAALVEIGTVRGLLGSSTDACLICAGAPVPCISVALDE